MLLQRGHLCGSPVFIFAADGITRFKRKRRFDLSQKDEPVIDKIRFRMARNIKALPDRFFAQRRTDLRTRIIFSFDKSPGMGDQFDLFTVRLQVSQASAVIVVAVGKDDPVGFVQPMPIFFAFNKKTSE